MENNTIEVMLTEDGRDEVLNMIEKAGPPSNGIYAMDSLRLMGVTAELYGRNCSLIFEHEGNRFDLIDTNFAEYLMGEGSASLVYQLNTSPYIIDAEQLRFDGQGFKMLKGESDRKLKLNFDNAAMQSLNQISRMTQCYDIAELMSQSMRLLNGMVEYFLAGGDVLQHNRAEHYVSMRDGTMVRWFFDNL